MQTRQTPAALCEAVLERVFEAVTHCLFQADIYIERGSKKMQLQLSQAYRKDLHGWQSSVKFSNALGQTINNARLEDVPFGPDSGLHFGFPADKPEAFGVVLAHTTILFCFRELIGSAIQELDWQAK